MRVGRGSLSLGRRRRCAFTFLISTLVALQRGICVSFMCGFSDGYDAVAIATLPTSPRPPHCHCLWLPILVVVVPLCFGLSRRGVNCFLCQCLPRLIAVHSRLHKQVGVVNPIKQQSRVAQPPLDGWVDNPPSGRQFKLIINASANIVVIIHAPVAPPVG